ncbi:MAG: hypothetical protein HYU36_22350 [Planctomycetes bacterium]|nr:hypothetical protein [Planctomycetota bacterium]
MGTSKSASGSRATDLRDHGIAVYSGSCLSVRAWRDAKTDRDYVYCGITSTSSLVVQVDVATGRCRSFRLPKPCSGPWGIDFTLDGHLLVTSCCGRLCRIDPRKGKVWVTANTGHWLWVINRGADGKFYLGSSSECRLFRYDAATEGLEDLGQLDGVQKYLRGVAGGDDGYIYGSIGCTAAQVVAYPIANGRVTKLLPKFEECPGFQRIVRGPDGRLTVHTLRGKWYHLSHGQAFPLRDAEARQMTKEYPWGLPESLPDGRPVTHVDPDAIRIGEGPKATIIPLKYKSDGANIFHLAEGPAETVYASTIMPLYILRYTPATRKLENLGRGGPDNGEAYSFGHCDGKLYYACYSYGNLMRYDPTKPLHKDPPGAMKWNDNPKLITQLGMGHNRPRAMCVDSKKRVWIGSFPEYGMNDGGLGCYDTVRRKYENNPVVIRNQSIIALTADAPGDILYGGTSIGRGSGTDPVTKEAHLFALDARRRRLLWRVVPIPGVIGVLNLLYLDGKLYGTTGGAARGVFHFFRFDPRRRTMDYVMPSEISGVREQSLCIGPDGNIYGITWITIFRWIPETGKIEVLYRCSPRESKRYPGGSLFHRGAVILGGRLYFSCGPHVMSMRLPL